MISRRDIWTATIFWIAVMLLVPDTAAAAYYSISLRVVWTALHYQTYYKMYTAV